MMSDITIAEKLAAIRSLLPQKQLLLMTVNLMRQDTYAETSLAIEVLYERFMKCPRTYQTDGNKGKAVCQFRYFAEDSEYHIVELDVSGPPHHQAYGYGSLNGYYPELGYISIPELMSAGFELDLQFVPQTLSELKLWKEK